VKIRVGIAGFGKIGKIRANELKKFSQVDLVGIYDIEKTEDYSNSQVEFCENFEDLISLNIDAVFICTYNNVLAEYSRYALSKGVHVFCEKPPARTVKELKKVLEYYKASNKILKYGFNHRYHYSVMEAKRKIAKGDLGKIIWIRGVYGKAGSIDYDKNWRNYKKFSGGGILIDQGIHMVDLIRYLSNQNFTEVSSYVTTSFWKIKAEDNAFAMLKSEENIVAMIHSSATQWRHKFLLEICFENGYINLDGILSNTRSYAPEKLITAKREFEDITFAMGKPKESITWFENDDSWYLEIKEFIDAIEKGKPIENGTIYDAIETLSLIEKIYEKSGFNE